MSRVPFIAGNWKMNKTQDEAVFLVRELATRLKGVEGVDIAVAPPFTALSAVKQAISSSDKLELAAQNVFHELSGAYTGELSPPMLVDVGVKYVILGHSERRQILGETSEFVNKKVIAALMQELSPIICIGETLEERDAGRAFEVVDAQLKQSIGQVSTADAGKLTIAYEPVWAIGTGKTATVDQVKEMHEHVRGELNSLFGEGPAEDIRIQYGGSVKPENAAELLALDDVDGALVGGASLKAESFAGIVKAAVS